MTQSASAQIAPISRRAIGFLIDAFIAAGLAIVLGGGLVVAATLAGPEGMLTTLLIGGLIVLLLLLGWFVVYTLMQAGAGSIGMRAQGLRLVSAREQGPLGFGRALLRNIIFGSGLLDRGGLLHAAVRRLGSFPGLARQGRRFADGGCAGDGSRSARPDCCSRDVSGHRTRATGRVRVPLGH